jgi:RNA polymerase sigma factor (sigma-70 family)
LDESFILPYWTTDYINKLNLDRDTRLDVEQEARIAIWQERQANPEASEKYLAKAGINAIRRFLRDDRGEFEGEKLIALDNASEEDLATEEVDSLLDRMEFEGQSAAIRCNLCALSPNERAVIELALDGKDTGETVRELGISKESVWAHKSNAIKKLRAILSEPAGGD